MLFQTLSDVSGTPPSELSHEELGQLVALGTHLTQELDLDTVFSLVAQSARKVVDAETMVVPIIDDIQQCFTYRAAAGKHSDILLDQTFPLHEGSCGWVIRNRRPLLFGKGGSYEMDQHATWLPGMASSLLVPLICRGKIIGGLSAMGKENGQAFTPHDLTLLTLFANQASIAIDNAWLFKRIEAESTRLRLVLDSTGEGIFGIDLEGCCTFANPTCLRLLGYPDENTLIGQHMHTLAQHRHTDGSGISSEDCYIHRAMRTGQETHVDNDVIQARDGRVFPIEGWARPMLLNGQIIGAVATFIDISRRRQDEKRIHELAYYDPLTRLPNRRLLLDRLAQAMLSSERTGDYGALVMLDLDNFKLLNDTRGHDTGDQLLIEVAHRLRENLRSEDTIARLGGDEYILLIESLGTDESHAASQVEGIANHLRNLLNAPYLLHVHEAGHHCSCSLGVTLFQGRETNLDLLMKQADLALYQAKAAGRNAIRFFNPAMQAAIDARSHLENALRRALQQDELCLHFQPQISLSGQITGAEALLRWQSPDATQVSTQQMISLAEDTGLIVPIGMWVLREACLQLKRWQAHASTVNLSLSVNVSARQFRESDFIAQLRRILTGTGIDASGLILELTESILLDHAEDTIRRMHEIRQTGVRFALDDFGTGFSSLSYLKRLPFDEIKIDRSFTHEVANNPNDAAIVRAILAMSSSLGLSVIAEGVETREQKTFLQSAGCTRFQGYLFGRPMPIRTWDKFLRASRSYFSEQ